MKRMIELAMVLLAFAATAAYGGPQFRNAGAGLTAEQRVNRVIESGERVTVSLALKNVGNEPASNLIATIQTGEGVLDADPPERNYGALAPGAASVAREFTFTAAAPTNALLEVKLDLSDGGQALGTVTFRYRIGPQVTTVSNTNGIHINPIGAAVPFPSVISVSNVAGSIVDVSLTLSNLNHVWPDDLDILLVSPSGDAVLVMSDACGIVEMSDTTLAFADGADEFLPDFALPTLPFYKPTNHGVGDPFPAPAPSGPYAGVMSAFNGKSAIGDWKLYIVDDYFDGFPDGGILGDGWSLRITTLQPVDAGPTVSIARNATNETVRVTVIGSAGYSYVLEAAPDPLQTLLVETFVMPTSGVRTFEFPIEAGNLFFRAATNP